MCSSHQNLVSHSKLKSLELLPTELLDVIFDDFHQDIASLKACSMVSPTLRPVCQAHIFHTATLECVVFNTGTGPILSHRHFLDAISASPRLASLVRELRFTRLRSSGAGATLLRVPEEERVVHQRVVADILVVLPQLKTLVLRTPSGSLIWSRLSVALTTALTQVVRLPTLCHLDLGVTWEVPAAFFRSLSKLQVLRFAELNLPLVLGPKAESLETADDVGEPLCGRFECESLHSLSILSTMSYPCIDALFFRSTRLLDITRLQSLTLAFIDGEPVVRQILEVCGRSLDTFRMHMQQRQIEEPPNHELDFGLQHLERVTSLTFSSSATPAQARESSIVSWLALAAGTLPSPERLEHLTVVCEIPYAREVASWSEDTWSTLNALLRGFPGLRSVQLVFFLSSSAGPTDENEWLASVVRERAGWVAGTGVLEVSVVSELPSCFL